MKVQQKLKSARVKQGLTLLEVQKRTGILKSTLSQVERGKSRYYPKESDLKRLAEVLNLDSDDLALATGRIPDRFKALVEEKSGEVLAFLKQLETDRQC